MLFLSSSNFLPISLEGLDIGSPSPFPPEPHPAVPWRGTVHSRVCVPQRQSLSRFLKSPSGAFSPLPLFWIDPWGRISLRFERQRKRCKVASEPFPGPSGSYPSLNFE